jgi:uncharacterized protein
VSRLRRWSWAAGAPFRLLLIGLIRAYRMTLSGWLGGQCRFHPTCSEYAEEAVRSAGAARGAALAIWRILRCSPLSGGGVDRPPRRRSLYDSDIHRADAA